MTLPECGPERTPQQSSPLAVLSKARIAPREPAPASRLTPTPSLPLSARHLRELQEGSGIAPDLIAERGYGTITASEALALGFSEDQARSGLLIPFYTPDGELSYQLKPDNPRVVDGKTVKYETRTGHNIVLDVHPSNYWRLLNADEPIYVVEGIKKADCAASRGRLVVGLSGVWNWGKKRKRGGAKYGRPELLSDWDAFPLEGRRVYLCFDADYREKRSVALALLRLAERLTERGTHVYILNLPGPEKGLDDYVVVGGNLEVLEVDARPFTPSDLIRYAAKPDKRIWKTVVQIADAMAMDDWSERGAATTHSLVRALLGLALLGGRYDRDTGKVEVVASTRELRQYAAIGSPNTLSKHTAKAEERGYLEKVTGERSKGKANRYILKLSEPVSLIERGGEISLDSTTGTPLDNFAPHLRWPAPASAAAKGDERDSKLPEAGAMPENYPHEKPELPSIYREDDNCAPNPEERAELEVALGKTVELALHLLLSWGGEGYLRDLSTATGLNHTGKLRAKLEEVPGVFGLDPKGKHGARVWVEDGWRHRLDERRERDGELRQARQQAVRHRQHREAFQANAPTNEEPPLMGAERVEKMVEACLQQEAERKAERVAEAQRRAERFVADTLADSGAEYIRFGLLVDMWTEARGGTHRHGTWTLRKALSALGCVLRPHRETPGEMFVYQAAHSRKSETESRPEKVDGIHHHGPLCGCGWCDMPVQPRYVRDWSGA